MSFCGNCGTQLPEGAAHCPNCGTAVAGGFTQAAAEAVDNAAQAANETVNETVNDSLNAANDAAQAATETVNEAAQATDETVNEAAGAAGAAFGAAAGATQDAAGQAQQEYQQQTYQQQTYQQQNYQHQGYAQASAPAPKQLHPVAAGIIAYVMSWIGLIIIALAGDTREPYTRFHLNQGLVLFLFDLVTIPLYVLSLIPFVGVLIAIISFGWGIFMLVLKILAFIGACKGEMRSVPLLGQIQILK